MTTDRRSNTAYQPLDAPAFDFRSARVSDGAEVWRLVAESPVLDTNSAYCYLLLCRDFGETCVVARRAAQLAGFVMAYRPPQRPSAVFVWQIGVDASARRRGLGRRLLHQLVSLPACREVRFLEATVTPSNTASRRLFEGFARDLNVPCRIEQGFTAEMFGNGGHEEEELFRIGPFDLPKDRPGSNGGISPLA